MNLVERCKRASSTAVSVVAGAAIIAIPPTATNWVGYKLSELHYRSTPCSEYRAPREDIFTFATFGIGRQMYISKKCKKAAI